MSEELNQSKYILEAVLFASGDKLNIKALAECIDASKAETIILLSELASEYDYSMRGLKLVSADDEYQIVSRPEYFPFVSKVLTNYTYSELSNAAMETLAIVAYKQPVTRAEIEQIRGVHSTSSLDLLIDRGLVKNAGKIDAPGRPYTYETTGEFLKLMQINSVKDLKSFDEFMQQLAAVTDQINEDTNKTAAYETEAQNKTAEIV